MTIIRIVPSYFNLISFGIIMVCLFWGLDHYGLSHNNDGLYAEIAREMIVRNDYIVPYLNGVPYIEKPPLLYWLVAGSYKLFGIHEWSARLITTLSGLMTVITIYFSARRFLNDRVATVSALIMGSSIGIIIISRVIFFEMLLTCLLSLTLFCYLHWHLTHQRHFLRLSYIAMALAILAKGFVSIILAGLVIFIFNMTIRLPLRSWIKDFDIIGLCLFLIIVLPWHLLMMYRDVNFAWFYFVNEHVLRFLGQRQPQDYYRGPLYYYIHRMAGYLFPWSLLLPTFLIPQSLDNQRPIDNTERVYKLFMIIWLATLFVFFSLSQAKANYYLITAMPPLIILLAQRLESLIVPHQKIVSWIIQAFIIVMALAAWAAIIVKNNGLPIHMMVRVDIRILIALDKISNIILLAIIASGPVSLLLQRMKFNHNLYHYLLLGTMNMLLIITAAQAMIQFESLFSARKIVQQLNLQSHQTCYYQDFERLSAFAFYLASPLPIIDSQSHDLLYGQQKNIRPDLFLASNRDRVQIVQKCHNVVVSFNKIRMFARQFNNYIAVFTNQNLTVFQQQ